MHLSDVITFLVGHENIINIVTVTSILVRLARMPDFTVTRMESHEE